MQEKTDEGWPTYARTMAAYNQWMNRKILTICATLTDVQRKEDKGAFFKSIHGTLNHILLADKIWMGRFLDEPFQVDSLAQELYADFDALCIARDQQDQSILAWVAGLQVDHFGETLNYLPATSSVPKSLPMWLAVTHFFNHQTHHRGQVTALLSQLGKDPGVTDLPFM